MLRAAALALALTGCAAGDEDSWLLLGERSPEGGQVARLWCPNLCDVDEDVSLTVTPADHPLALHRNVPGFPAEGEMPVANVVWTGHRQLVDGLSRLRWRDATTVEVTLPCIAGAVRPGRWRVALIEGAAPRRCRR